MTKNMGNNARRGLVVAVAIAAFMAFAVSAGAQTYTPTPSPNVLELSTNTPSPGGTFTGRGCGFAPGSSVDATIGGSPAGTITVGADGCAVGTMQAPGQPGTYTVCYTGMLPGLTQTQQLCNTITVGAAQGATSQVPFTGTRSLALVAVIGAALLLVGSVMVVSLRRRRFET